jgi:hypothetical protein
VPSQPEGGACCGAHAVHRLSSSAHLKEYEDEVGEGTVTVGRGSSRGLPRIGCSTGICWDLKRTAGQLEARRWSSREDRGTHPRGGGT